MAWSTRIHTSRGNRGGWAELHGSTLTPAEDGWDTATLSIAHRGPVSDYFARGDAHPDHAGLYVTAEPEQGEVWRGDIFLSTVKYAGLYGGVSGMVTRQQIEGSQRIERTITAQDFYGGGAGYGTTERPLFSVPGGVADAIRLISLQPYCEKQFITDIGPPSVYSLESLKIGAKILQLAPPVPLGGPNGIELIYNMPDGMLASSVKYTHHPAPTVDMWLLDIRWEAVPERDIA